MANVGYTRVVAMAATLCAGGCGVSLTPAGQQVKVMETSPVDCERLGEVNASAAGGHGEDKSNAARIELRNQTGEMGGNVVYLEREKEEGQLWRLEGVAFRCAAAP